MQGPTAERVVGHETDVALGRERVHDRRAVGGLDFRERGDELAGKRGLELPHLNAEGLVGPPHVGILQRNARSSRPYATGTELALNPPAHVAEDACRQRPVGRG